MTGGSDSKEYACNAGDMGSIPGSRRSSGDRKMATHSSILAWRIPCPAKTLALSESSYPEVARSVLSLDGHKNTCFAGNWDQTEDL